MNTTVGGGGAPPPNGNGNGSGNGGSDRPPPQGEMVVMVMMMEMVVEMIHHCRLIMDSQDTIEVKGIDGCTLFKDHLDPQVNLDKMVVYQVCLGVITIQKVHVKSLEYMQDLYWICRYMQCFAPQCNGRCSSIGTRFCKQLTVQSCLSPALLIYTHLNLCY